MAGEAVSGWAAHCRFPSDRRQESPLGSLQLEQQGSWAVRCTARHTQHGQNTSCPTPALVPHR